MRTLLLVYITSLTLLLVASVAGGALLLDSTGPDDAVEDAADDHGYDFFRWEAEHFPRKWVYKAHHLLFGAEDRDDDAVLVRYFALTDEIRSLRRQAAPGARLDQAQRERGDLEGVVEDILEGRITTILEDQDLALEPPLFSDLGLIFPPVDFELDSPPRVLAISPRNRIEFDRSYLLEPGLKRESFAGIEERAESDNGPGGAGVSALVVGTGGVGTYPSVVSADDDYAGVVETAFHEWLHNYLVFFPLGRSYFSGDEARTLNESVASIGGKALAHAYFGRYGSPSAPAPDPGGDPSFDFTAEMRALRREVEGMLAGGDIEGAEALMESRRLEFQERGVFLRKLNQAYFAFHGFYADSPGSIDPIGPQLEKLLAQSGSPGRFVEAARGVTTRAGLDAVLADTGG